MNSPTAPTNQRRRGALSVLVGVAVALALGEWLRIDSPRALLAYPMMAKECHPVWRDFAVRRFSRGDSMEALFTAHTPSWQRSLGDIMVCEFHPVRKAGVHPSPVRVTAVRGRLVSAEAGSCTWWHTFFADFAGVAACGPALAASSSPTTLNK